MKKSGVLNIDISELIAGMGHMDELTICDAGLPIPDKVRRIDLAVSQGLPAFLDVVKEVAGDLQVQQIILASELGTQNPGFDQKIKDIFVDIPVLYIPHDEFKSRSQSSRAIIRTGEFTPYANIILVSGVIF